MLRKIPVTSSGVMLGIAALGSLLESLSAALYAICGLIAAVICILLILRTFLHFRDFAEEMSSPVTAAVSGTFSMGMMFIAVYLKPFAGSAAATLWFSAIALHITLMIYFTVRFAVRSGRHDIFAGYYIVYVGIAAAAVSAPAFEMEYIGRVVFIFAAAAFIILILPVSMKYIRCRDLPDGEKPLFCITAAPASLCLAAFLQSFNPGSVCPVILMALLATIMYLIVLFRLPGSIRTDFSPSHASFTFPFVISASAIKMTATFLSQSGCSSGFPYALAFAETIIAVVLVTYTFLRFAAFSVKR